MGLYTNYWIQVLPEIKEKLAMCDEPQKLALSEKAFKAVGKRMKSPYSFNLEFENGTQSNGIGGTAVARDLARVIESDMDTRALIKRGHFKLNMNKEFVLKIQKL